MNHIEIIITSIAAIATIWIAITAQVELRRLAKMSKVDFLIRYEWAFFGKDNDEIICALDNNAIKYAGEEGNKHFQIVSLDGGKIKEISGFRMEQLFGYFVTLGYLEKRNDVGIDYIYEIFEPYATKLWKLLDGEYLKLCMTAEKDAHIYDNFRDLVSELQLYHDKKKKSLVRS